MRGVRSSSNRYVPSMVGHEQSEAQAQLSALLLISLEFTARDGLSRRCAQGQNYTCRFIT
jgi:hypothetical protein